MCVGVLEGYSHPYIFKAEKSRACVCARERERHTRARAPERERARRESESGGKRVFSYDISPFTDGTRTPQINT